MEQPSEQRRGIQTTTAVVGIRGSFPTERKEAYYLRCEWDLSGGGCEMIVNADMVIACEKAFFGFPEVQRGVVAIAGALPRVVRTIGRQRAMEMVLTGRRVTAVEAEKWGFVNEVLPTPEEVVTRALEIAGQIAANSPDAVIVSREGVKLGWEGVGAEEGSRWLIDGWQKRLNEGENIKEGLRAFVEKRQPKWVDSKL